ncbi:MAG: dipeptidase [Phycisphaerae bacterium]
MIDKIDAYIEEHKDRFIESLRDFLTIPCISTDSTRAEAMAQGAQWVKDRLTESGIEAEIVPTEGHPAVLADTGPVEGGPTVLVYGHYDVQPQGDLSLWNSPPFEPTVREGKLFARGAADDKGQVLTHVIAAAAWLKVAGKLPVRVKYIIEGEEEIGSPHLGGLIQQHRDRLACDYVVISDTAKLNEDVPAITYGTKGMVYKEIILTGPSNDLHSGSFGGTVCNPGNALAFILAGLKDGDQRVTIPGFYEDVQTIGAEELKSLESLPFDEASYLASLGAPALAGEAGYSTLQRRWVRPTLDVNGLYGGFMGEGSSTIIPAKVGAKVSMRIVPDQDPEKISQAFDRAVRALCPKGVRLEILDHAVAAAYVCPIDNPGIKAGMAAVEAGFGKKPALIREGGTLPILPMFRQVLGAESIMMGFCVPNCNAHGPNEFLAISDFVSGIRTSAHFFHEMARI